MANRVARWILVLVVLVVSELVSRSAAAETEKAPSKIALLAPMNFQLVVPSVVEEGFKPTEAVLNAYLKRDGYKLKKLGLAKFREIWRSSASAAAPPEGPAGYDEVIGATLSYLSERIEFDVFVVPTMVVRSIQASGGGLRWDGVFQTIRWNRPRTGNRNIETVRFNEPVDTVSLRVEVWSREARMLHEGVGGLEVLAHAKFDYKNGGFEWLLRDDLFEDPKTLKKGVRAALEPFIAND